MGSNLQEESDPVSTVSKRKSGKAQLYVVLWVEWIYEVRFQRCKKEFQGSVCSKIQVARNITFRDACTVINEIRDFLLT